MKNYFLLTILFCVVKPAVTNGQDVNIKIGFRDIKKIKRNYLPVDFVVTTWESLEPYFKELANRPLANVEEFEKWLKDMSELEAVVIEDAC